MKVDELDQELLDLCFNKALNIVRQGRGLDPVAYSNRLDATAFEYAGDMNELDFFGHIHPHRESRRTPLDRILLNWPDVKYTGENLAEFSPYKIPTMRARYFVKELPNGEMQWLDHRKRPLELHTYWSFAEFITDKWMGSAGHRENLLNENFEFVGMGYAVNSRKFPDEIPTLFIVQNFGTP